MQWRVPCEVGWISLMMLVGLNLPGGVVNSLEAAKEKVSRYERLRERGSLSLDFTCMSED